MNSGYGFYIHVIIRSKNRANLSKLFKKSDQNCQNKAKKNANFVKTLLFFRFMTTISPHTL